MSLKHYLRRPPAVAPSEAIGLHRREAALVDVRRRFEVERSRVPGALWIPLEALEERCDELPDDRLLLTFCTGGIRSAAAAVLLLDLGFDAANVSRGLIGWRAAGGPLES